MGMFLSDYSMLAALEGQGDEDKLRATKEVLARFNLFGLVIHDPNEHQAFDQALSNEFQRLDFLSG